MIMEHYNEDGEVDKEKESRIDWCVFSADFFEEIMYFCDNGEGQTNIMLKDGTPYVCSLTKGGFEEKIRELHHQIIR